MKILIIAALLQQNLQLAKKPDLELDKFRNINFGIVADVARFSDGTIGVIDSQNRMVFLFDSLGNPTKSFGRAGQGPGEFTFMSLVGSCNSENITILDVSSYRITTLSSDARLINIKATQDYVGKTIVYQVICANDGTKIIIEKPNAWGVKFGKDKGPYRAKTNVSIVSPNKTYKVLGSFDGPEYFVWPKTAGPRPFGKKLVITAANKIYVGTADSFYVEVFNLKGDKVGSIKHNVPIKDFTSTDLNKYHQDLLIQGRARGRIFDLKFLEERSKGVIPDKLPAYDSFVTNGNNIWIQESNSPTETTKKWYGFDENYKFLGILQVPTNFQVVSMTNNTVLGKWTEEDGAESVRRYRLVVRLTK